MEKEDNNRANHDYIDKSDPGFYALRKHLGLAQEYGRTQQDDRTCEHANCIQGNRVDGRQFSDQNQGLRETQNARQDRQHRERWDRSSPWIEIYQTNSHDAQESSYNSKPAQALLALQHSEQ